MIDEDCYVDVRHLHPEFERYDCKFCGHGWIRDTTDRPGYGRCPDCGYTQDNEYMAAVYGVRKVAEGMGVRYLDAETGEPRGGIAR